MSVSGWEHSDEWAVRNGPWKAKFDEQIGQLFPNNIDQDQMEMNNLADNESERLNLMRSKWIEWAKSTGVLPKRGLKY